MKVLVFTTLFPNKVMPNHGAFVKERIRYLTKLCEVRVVSPVPYFPKLKISNKWFKFSQVPLEEEIEGLKVYHPRYLITPKIFRSLYGIFMFLSVAKFVKRLKKEFNFDLIDAHFVYPDGLCAVLLGKFLKRKVIITARGTDINWYPNFRIVKRLIQYTLRRADFIISVSKNLKEKIVNLGVFKEKIKVIPNGVDFDKFFPISQQQAKRILYISEDRKVLLSIGHLLESKGFHLLIEALKIMKNSNLFLYIIGGGPYKNKLKKLIGRLNLEDKVKLLGEKPQNELYKWYSSADLFCLTSLREGRPNVVLEALACGVPVVSMNKWGLAEFIDEDKGILLDSYSSAIIAKAIEKALGKNWDREKIASSIRRQFNWDKTAKEVYEIFRKVKQKRDILFFSSDDWDSGLKTSKYHLASGLSKKNRVVFIESIGLRKPQAKKRDFKRMFVKIRKWLKGLRKIDENLYIFTPLVIPLHSNKLAHKFNVVSLKLQIVYIKKKLGIKNPLYWTFLPNTVELLKPFSQKLIYYCVDNMSAFKGVDGESIAGMDRELTRLAKVVFCVSQPIYERKRVLNKNTYYMPHGVNFTHFSNNHRLKPKELIDIPGPIIGFYGLISYDWIDTQLISFIAKVHPEWSIVMIGKIDMDFKELPKRENIYYLGPVDYERLPSYGRFFDVAIIPFKRNDLTYHCNPLKVYEYLAMGKPVVSVDIPEIHRLKGMVDIAYSYDEFVSKIEDNLSSQSTVSSQKRVEFARNNSWRRKIEEIWSIVEKYC